MHVLARVHKDNVLRITVAVHKQVRIRIMTVTFLMEGTAEPPDAILVAHKHTSRPERTEQALDRFASALGLSIN